MPDAIGSGIGQLRQPEVHDLDVTLAGEHHVLGLQIAVNDAGLVRLRERIRQLAGDLKGLLQRRSSASQQLPECRAFDELHHDEELAVELPDVVDGDDAGVIQGGRRSCFVLEAPDGARVRERLDAENFDGDLAAELRVSCPIDLAHAARSEQSENLVWATERTGSEGHLSGRLSLARSRRL